MNVIGLILIAVAWAMQLNDVIRGKSKELSLTFLWFYIIGAGLIVINSLYARTGLVAILNLVTVVLVGALVAQLSEKKG